MRIASLIPSVPEIQTLLSRILLASRPAIAFVFAWSLWRRRHQAEAAIAHYKRCPSIDTQL